MSDLVKPEPIESEPTPFKVLVPGGHGFELDSNGDIDDWVLGEGFHNGPGCVFCGASFCQHCERDVYRQLCEKAPIVIG